MSTKLIDVPIGDLELAPENVRTTSVGIEELAESIKELGVLEPILVRQNGGNKFAIIAGSRRFEAAKKAGLKDIPAVVRATDDAVMASAAENLAREGLTVIEEAQTYEVMVANGMSQRDIAKVVARGQSHVSKRLALLKLPEEVQSKVASGAIEVSDAQELSKLGDDEAAIKIAVSQATGTGGFRPSMSVVVGQLLEDRAEEQAIRKVAEDAKKKGMTVIDPDDYEGDAVPIGPGTRFAHVDEKKHEKLGCHVVVATADGVEPFCIDPSAHPAPRREKSERKLTPQQEAIVAEQDWEKEVDRSRRDFLFEVAKKRVPAGDRNRLIALALVAGVRSSEASDAVKFLDLEIIDGPYGHASTTHTLDQFAAKNDEQLFKAAFAVSLAVTSGAYMPRGNTEQALDKLLKAQGWKPPRKPSAPKPKTAAKSNVTPISKARGKKSTATKVAAKRTAK